MPINVQTLINNAACLCGVDKNELLRIIAANVSQGCASEPVTCENLEGESDDPTGVETPTFIGQVYVGPNTIWQATGLTSADWTLLSDTRILTLPDATVDEFILTEVTSLIALSFPNLTSTTANILTGNLALNTMPNLVSIGFPLLATMDGALTLSALPAQTLSFPSLTSIAALNMDSNVDAVVLSVPLLTTIAGDATIQINSGITVFSFPSLVTIGGNLNATNNTALTSFSAPNWLPTDGTTIEFQDCALDATSVNHILARCVAGAVTTCAINLSLGTNAAPTGQGITDKADLITAGNSVLTN